MSLNPNQERVVAVTLRLLEERLAEIDRLMTTEESGILYHRAAGFSPNQRKRMSSIILEMREAIQAVAETFHLSREEQNPARMVMALASVTWESLEDLYAHRLTAYGAADPKLKETLDPWARKLTRLIRALEDTALQEH